MLNIMSITFLAFALSLDGFGVGVSYGFRNIKIPLRSIFIMTILAALVLLVSMELGNWLIHYLSPFVANMIGAIILITVGCWGFYNIVRSNKKPKTLLDDNGTNEEITKEIKTNSKYCFEIKALGLIIQILKTPTNADLDKSGVISGTEAIFLGVALSLDSFGAGIGASLLGFSSPLISLTTGLMNFIFILLGIKIGTICSMISWMKRLSYIPGMILILYGIMKII